jgi:hypothetical protein
LAASGASVAALALRRLAPRRNKDSTGGCQVLEDEDGFGRFNHGYKVVLPEFILQIESNGNVQIILK